MFTFHHGHQHRVVPRERVIVAADAMHELHRPSARAAWHQSIVIVDARVVVHHHVISIRARAIIAESASASCRAKPKLKILLRKECFFTNYRTIGRRTHHQHNNKLGKAVSSTSAPASNHSGHGAPGHHDQGSPSQPAGPADDGHDHQH